VTVADLVLTDPVLAHVHEFLELPFVRQVGRYTSARQEARCYTRTTPGDRRWRVARLPLDPELRVESGLRGATYSELTGEPTRSTMPSGSV
jgi:hypothetical protein